MLCKASALVRGMGGGVRGCADTQCGFVECFFQRCLALQCEFPGPLTKSQGRPDLSSCPWRSLAVPPSSSSSCQCMNLWEKPWQPPLSS